MRFAILNRWYEMAEIYEYYQELCRWLYGFPVLYIVLFVIRYIYFRLYEKIKYSKRYVLPNIFQGDYLITQYFGENSKAATYKIGWAHNGDAPKPFLDTIDKSYSDATEEMKSILYLNHRYSRLFIYKLHSLGFYFVYWTYGRDVVTELVFPLCSEEKMNNLVPYIPHFICIRRGPFLKSLPYPGDYRFKKPQYQDQMSLIRATENPESTQILDQLFENDSVITPLHNLTEMGAKVTIHNDAVHIHYAFQKDYHKVLEYTKLLQEALPSPENSSPDYTKEMEFEQKLPSFLRKELQPIDIPPLRNAFILLLIALGTTAAVQFLPLTKTDISIDISEFFIPSFLLIFFAFDTKSLNYKIRRIWSFHWFTGFFISLFLFLIVSQILSHWPW